MIESNAMIKIDFTAKITNDNGGTVFDTTNKETAQSELIYEENKQYEPMLVVLGKGWVPKGLEKALINASIGDELDIHVACEDAYGPKDPSKIKLVARREFQKQNINPSVGDRITIGNQTGTVLSVSNSRVRMDYNHILAGKNIDYQIIIHDIIDGDLNKIAALIKRRIPGAKFEELDINVENDIIKVRMPENARYFEYIQFAKKEASNDISEIVTGYKGVEFIEYFNLLS